MMGKEVALHQNTSLAISSNTSLSFFVNESASRRKGNRLNSGPLEGSRLEKVRTFLSGFHFALLAERFLEQL